jgi:formylglycine-generating enzyme
MYRLPKAGATRASPAYLLRVRGAVFAQVHDLHRTTTQWSPGKSARRRTWLGGYGWGYWRRSDRARAAPSARMACTLLHSLAMNEAKSEPSRCERIRGALTFLALVFLVVGCGNPKPAGHENASPDTAGAGGDAQQSDVAAGGSFTCSGDAVQSATIPVPGGEFIMGCNAAVDQNCGGDENPMRSVTLTAFEIDQTEVTQGNYTACVTQQGCSPPSCAWNCSEPASPAVCVTWEQAKAYCAWAGRRLPTEAEWELAARGTDGRKYPWGNDEPDCSRANMAGCSGMVDAVGLHPGGASPYGAVDMSGNVVEMVADWYDSAYYQTAPNADPTGPASGSRYGGRGGGYKSEATWQRTSARDWYDIEDNGPALGFRCAR